MHTQSAVNEVPLEPLLTTSQAAALVGRPEAGLRWDRMKGKGIPFIRLGRAIRYHPQDIIRTLAAARVERN